jgi:uncharacterized protein involved in exopolysaccharide biosynthesis
MKDSGAVISVDDDRGEPRMFRLANLVLRYRYLLAFLPLVVMGAAVLLVMSQPRMYVVRTSFIPNRTSEQPQFGAIAQQLGMRLSTGDGGSSPAFYAALLTTRDILSGVVEAEYVVPTDDGEKRGNLIDFFELGEVGGARSPLELAMEQLLGSLTVSSDWDTNIVRVSVVSLYPELSEQIAARLMALTQEFDLTKRRTQASARRQFAEQRFEEGRAEMRRATAALEAFVGSNRLFNLSPLQTLEYSRLQQEVRLRMEVYTALTQTYEQARIDEVRDTPVITVLENPVGASVPQARGTVTKGILSLFFGFGLAILIAVMRDRFHSARRANEAEYAEFVRLRSEALSVFRPWSRVPRRVVAVD